MAVAKCNWCGKAQNEVLALIPSNSGACICDGCCRQGLDAVEEAQQKAKAKDQKPLPKPLEILTLLDEYVIGQTRAKEIVATAVYDHYKRIEAERLGLQLDVEIEKSNILMTGPSGCGKTQVARTIAKILDVPFHIADATKMTQSGYAGDDVDTILQGLLEKCSWNVKQAERGIVVIDEIDKLARKSGTSLAQGRDVTGEGVQQALLKLVEGGEVTIAKGQGVKLIDTDHQASVTIDTSNILFICMGSFDGIKDVVQKRLDKSSRIGFGGKVKEEANADDIYHNMSEEDILEFGIIPELAGRLPILTSVLPLTEEELVKVLTEPKDALVKQETALWNMDKVSLTFTKGALKAIAEKASTRKTGARALRGIMAQLLIQHKLTMPSDSTMAEFQVTEDFVRGKGDPKITKKKAVAEIA